jgi:hypothetical protein
MKKVVLVCLVVVLSISVFSLMQSPRNDRPSLHSWIHNTGKVIQNLGLHILPTKKTDSAEPASAPAATSNINTEPTADITQRTINWHYAAENESPVTMNSADKFMLPDLFRKRTAEPKTSVRGKVHLDDGDKFEGAEVGVEIPTQL